MLVLACGCTNEPILKNVPQPPTSTAAGLGAAAAAAATLAEPDAAAKNAEKARKAGEPAPRGYKVHDTVPASVLDHLDESQAADQDAGVAPSTPTPDSTPAAPAPAPAVTAPSTTGTTKPAPRLPPPVLPTH